MVESSLRCSGPVSPPSIRWIPNKPSTHARCWNECNRPSRMPDAFWLYNGVMVPWVMSGIFWMRRTCFGKVSEVAQETCFQRCVPWISCPFVGFSAFMMWVPRLSMSSRALARVSARLPLCRYTFRRHSLSKPGKVCFFTLKNHCILGAQVGGRNSEHFLL